MKYRRLLVVILSFALVWTSLGSALAFSPTLSVDDLAQYGTVMTKEQMEATEGEVWPFVVGVAAGAVYGGFQYLAGPEEKSVSGFLESAGKGAAAGVIVAAAAAAVPLLAASSVAVVPAAELAVVTLVGAANGGALHGAMDTISHELKK